MKASEMADFVARVRRLFGGPMDEELWTIAKERIAALQAKACSESLDEYALLHGGPRSRFIPAKFLEIYSRRTEKLDADADRTAREAMKRKAEIGASLEAEQIGREWSDLRKRIQALPEADRSRALEALRRAGWIMRSEDPAGWTDTQALAIWDLATGAEIMTRDPQSGSWTVPVQAQRFWLELVPKPADSPLGAVLSGKAPRASQASERLQANPRAIPESHKQHPGSDLAPDEIPF